MEPPLVRGSGARTRPGGGEAWSLTERIEALALAIERNLGYCLTKEVWEHYRDLVSFETPCYPTLLGKRSAAGKLVGGSTLADMHILAQKLILKQPKQFPIASDRLQLVEAVRAKETKSKPAPKQKAA